jgi:hypothetical protein
LNAFTFAINYSKAPMRLKKYRLLLVLAFLSIFVAKMGISAAPVFFSHLDKELMNSVIMQIEQEHEADGESGKVLKFVEFKSINHNNCFICTPLLYEIGVDNNFIDHNKRYVNPYHPSVPTPPPNFS